VVGQRVQRLDDLCADGRVADEAVEAEGASRNGDPPARRLDEIDARVAEDCAQRLMRAARTARLGAAGGIDQATGLP